MNTMFGSSLPLIGCSLIYVIFVGLRIVLSNTYCVVFLFCLSLSYLCCRFLWIVYEIYNLFVRVSETGKKASPGRAFLSCFAASVN
jgi:hypothetical protein